jgi:hypothetical protein
MQLWCTIIGRFVATYALLHHILDKVTDIIIKEKKTSPLINKINSRDFSVIASSLSEDKPHMSAKPQLTFASKR